MNKRWSPVGNVAEHPGVAWNTVYEWLENRGLTSQRSGLRWKLELSEVDEWVKGRRRGRARRRKNDGRASR